MKILVDQAMPYWQDYFSSLGDVESFKAGDIHKHQLSNVNVLLVRSTTKVDGALLQCMPNLRFIGTATAGYDHLDIAAIESKGIAWSAAGGCNASAVTQYVICALLSLACKDGFLLSHKTIAIVGYGNVGKRVTKGLTGLGATLRIYDPPLQHVEATTGATCTTTFVPFEQVLSADIICVHAPFNSVPEYPSLHLFDASVLARLSPQQYLLNAGRGELIDNQALLKLKQSKQHNSVQLVLDVWENEPFINTELIPHCLLSSAHIAGHTLEGKALGTHMLYETLCELIETPPSVALSALLPTYKLLIPNNLQGALNTRSELSDMEIQTFVKELCFCVYDIENDDSVFRRYMAQSASFAKLRQQYPVRREFSAAKVQAFNTKIQEYLRALGFIISNGSATPP
ncbi:MAG: 4-phosphoerythronate dehydrogenase [Glaciecola sp.]